MPAPSQDRSLRIEPIAANAPATPDIPIARTTSLAAPTAAPALKTETAGRQAAARCISENLVATIGRRHCYTAGTAATRYRHARPDTPHDVAGTFRITRRLACGPCCFRERADIDNDPHHGGQAEDGGRADPGGAVAQSTQTTWAGQRRSSLYKTAIQPPMNYGSSSRALRPKPADHPP